MRFLLECVTCCTMMNPSSNTTEEPSSSPTPRTDETRSLVHSSAPSHRPRRSSPDWKPSLYAISEDNAVSATLQKPSDRKPLGQVLSQRNIKRYARSSVEINAHSRPHDFGRYPLPMVFPAFSAAPFMFSL